MMNQVNKENIFHAIDTYHVNINKTIMNNIGVTWYYQKL